VDVEAAASLDRCSDDLTTMSRSVPTERLIKSFNINQRRVE
jgi:hypothetical protein